MQYTHFAFARVDTTYSAKPEDIEAVLQLGLLKFNNLNKYVWFSEKNSALPNKDKSICNEYLTEDIENMITPSLPKKISVFGGQLIFH